MRNLRYWIMIAHKKTYHRTEIGKFDTKIPSISLNRWVSFLKKIWERAMKWKLILSPLPHSFGSPLNQFIQPPNNNESTLYVVFEADEIHPQKRIINCICICICIFLMEDDSTFGYFKAGGDVAIIPKWPVPSSELYSS